MSNQMLSDPLLMWLEPKELVLLSQLNKESRRIVREFQRTRKSYRVGFYAGQSYTSRQYMYSLYPNVESLEYTLISCGSISLIDEYLRPSLKSIHINIYLSLESSGTGETLEFLNKKRICDTLRLIEEYLKSPGVQLDSILLTLDKTVQFTLLVKDGIHVGYDKYGPLFEDSYDYFDVNDFDACYYFPLMDPKSIEEVGNAIRSLEASHPWKQFSAPDCFNSSSNLDPLLRKERNDVLYAKGC